MNRIAFYGGSFDPVHRGHLRIAGELTELFSLDEFVFIPAFHAPHKADQRPTSAYHRHAMLCLATRNFVKTKVSTMELEIPEKHYTVETLTRLLGEFPADQLFFVIGADSWMEITTWKEWEKVLTMVNIIVVTRPNFEIGFSHVTEDIRQRIVDTRTDNGKGIIDNSGPGESSLQEALAAEPSDLRIYITNAVEMDISSTKIRKEISNGNEYWKRAVSSETAKYIEKYNIYAPGE
ncbi:MAG: nicotinate-nucleotide adenylyltransferase [Acidobacteria bacterium]|nr:nicotinate-nucleotide adenylyltransferase [Acidobacteriota bacterium]